jgi:RNA polymerase sigma-32 factor
MTLPILSSDAGLHAYMQEIRKFPMLELEEEQRLAKRWADLGDIEAAHTLVTSHLRLVVKIAQGFRGYGLPIMELVSEGNIGLMQAVKKFDAEKGFRLSTYAMWWIKASIQEFVLRSWSLVKMGTTAGQKKLFFNLRRLKNRLEAVEGRHSLRPEDIEAIALELDVSKAEVLEMDSRLSQCDSSLNELVGYDDSATERLDLLAAPDSAHDEMIAELQEHDYRALLVKKALGTLNERERDVLLQRRMQEPPTTLEKLGEAYGVSTERVRQIEVRAFEKLQKAVQTQMLPVS